MIMALGEKRNMTDAEKEQVISQALATESGREALAQAMVEPIKIALEYQAVGRKLLMTDELPQGALARYERDIAVKSWVLGKRGAVPDSFVETEELLVPTFEIVTNPTIRLSEVKARRFYIVDRAQMKAKEAIQREEDTNIFNTIEAAVPAAHTVAIAGNLTVSALATAFAEIESHDLTVYKIVMHPQQYKDVRNFGKNVYDEATTREVLMSGLFGHLWTADIHVSTRVPEGKVFVLAPGEYVGAFPVRQDISVLPADDPKELRLGWVIYEEVGVTVINDYATAMVEVS